MFPLAHFLRQELRDAPGRASYTLRLTLSCAVLITLFMTLQIPFLAVALIVVFYVSQPNVLMIKLVSVVFVVTVTVALGGVLLIIKWTYDYPLIRLAASVALFFCAIYLMRVLGKLGLAFFVVALAVIYAQTFPSMTSQSEILVRLLLWLWVAINTAILVTLLVNACFQQAFPGNQFKARLAGMLHEVARRLTAPGDEAPPTFGETAAQFNQLQSLFAQASRATPEIAAEPQAWRSRLAATLRCYQLAALLQADEADSEDRQQLSQAVLKLKSALSEEQFDGAIPPLTLSGRGINRAVLQEMATLLQQLAQGEPVALPQGEVEKAPLLAPDAWRNPAYLHFALKTLLATLICYVFYTAADWQGLHTIMLSCVIVAQPGLGATMQKTWLRIGGALLATLLALLLIVFVQPWTDSLSGLLAMSLPVLALAAWIAAGSERIAYAGIQIGFTFALAFLSWFGPLTNLTELRDRVLGILLGVLVSSIVHLYLWPDSEAPQLKSRLAALYRRLADCLAAPKEAVPLAPLFVAFTDSEALLHRVRAEPLGTWAHPWPQAKGWPMRATLAQAEEIARLSEGYRLNAAPGDPTLTRCAEQLRRYAEHIEQEAAAPDGTLAADLRNPFGPALAAALATLPDWGPTPIATEQQAKTS
ncbi:Multidrug resistance protein MdtO [Klebsiella variicola]|uniref:multidrug efflux transporter permease subunit MdtO n=1 Tax=Klebsiella variicola TaxID=244366 RepID=UPI0007D0C87A|nr:multidrug efflux transporter permease subunit MdtO [Klebsiella variicola]SBN30176.1 Multidrug resistance protein MdtO [Klebsiella variicola]VGP97385.1 Multidrug resistance protein MdtO [Klebsiella variicola]